MENLILIAHKNSSYWLPLKLKTTETRPISIAAGEKIDLHFIRTNMYKEAFDIIFNIGNATLGEQIDNIIKIAGAIIPNFYKPY